MDGGPIITHTGLDTTLESENNQSEDETLFKGDN